MVDHYVPAAGLCLLQTVTCASYVFKTEYALSIETDRQLARQQVVDNGEQTVHVRCKILNLL